MNATNRSHRSADDWTTRHSLRATAGRTAALVNSLRGPAPDAPDPRCVAHVLREHGELDPVRVTSQDVTEMRAGANALYEVFAAGTVQEAALRLNRLLADVAGPPRLTAHGGDTPWHLHLDSDDAAPWGEWFLASSCMALAVLIGEHQRPPGGVCASPRCDNVYVSLGSGLPRRFCSRRCATRERVAHHRRAHAATPEPGAREAPP